MSSNIRTEYHGRVKVNVFNSLTDKERVVKKHQILTYGVFIHTLANMEVTPIKKWEVKMKFCLAVPDERVAHLNLPIEDETDPIGAVVKFD